MTTFEAKGELEKGLDLTDTKSNVFWKSITEEGRQESILAMRTSPSLSDSVFPQLLSYFVNAQG